MGGELHFVGTHVHCEVDKALDAAGIGRQQARGVNRIVARIAARAEAVQGDGEHITLTLVGQSGHGLSGGQADHRAEIVLQAINIENRGRIGAGQVA